MISVAGAPLSGRMYEICTLLSTGFVENRSLPLGRGGWEAFSSAGLQGVPLGYRRQWPVTRGSLAVRMTQSPALVHEQMKTDGALRQNSRSGIADSVTNQNAKAGGQKLVAPVASNF